MVGILPQKNLPDLSENYNLFQVVHNHPCIFFILSRFKVWCCISPQGGFSAVEDFLTSSSAFPLPTVDDLLRWQCLSLLSISSWALSSTFEEFLCISSLPLLRSSSSWVVPPQSIVAQSLDLSSCGMWRIWPIVLHDLQQYWDSVLGI